ncbi:unnamed protein product [Mycena citricolor]|uniref:Uncharacterized protein n=1 Tax=Mycena citricolor TaxID=2018698 RepID=A0AAD2JU01_9AGAR|nr:unnamed protein product [Mycena citricolor]
MKYLEPLIADWFKSTIERADELSKRFNKKPRYFLDHFFQGGARMVNHQEKVNPFNAFKAFKAKEIREGRAIGLLFSTLSQGFIEEYRQLSDEEKEKLRTDYTAIKQESMAVKRDTPRARSQDVSNVVRNMIMLVQALSYRVGVEGFFCIVRNSTDFYMEPQWFFTTQELERYMPIAVGQKWDLATVGAKVEAFAVAGCDTMRLLRTSKQKCDFLKVEIREFVNVGLREITKLPKAVMQYVHYREDIVVSLGVKLIGWTAGDIVNPSNLSTSVSVLTELRDAFRKGDARWVKLTREERQEEREQWDADVEAGIVIPKSREQRSDKGKKRKRHEPADSENREDDEDGVLPGSNEPGPQVEEPGEGDVEEEPPAKRSRRSAKSNGKRANAEKENMSVQPKKGNRARDDKTTRQAIARQKGRRSANSSAIAADSDVSDPTAPAQVPPPFTATAGSQ